MKAILLFALLSIAAVYAFSEIGDSPALLFTNWKKHYNKNYANPEEESLRFEVFRNNLAFVLKHNAEAALGMHTYTLGMNHLADLTNSEYRRMYLGYNANFSSNAHRHRHGQVAQAGDLSALPDTVDWRTKGIVTAVKDQGQCGSCWSFSTTGSVEGAVALKTGKLVSLSEQNLVDCVQGGSFTCQTGGVMQTAFAYIMSNKGIEGEADYPYCTCSGRGCKFDRTKIRATITSYRNVAQNEAAVQTAAAQQPVSIAIDASSQNFQLYKSGVFNLPSCSSTALDHGVLIVGYGTSGSSPYWLVKNSWSAAWGMQGYIMMSRNKNNQCGVATDASYPVA